MFRTLEESGGLNDNVNRNFGTKTYDTGAIQVAYDIKPWSHYGVPYPDCDNDPGSASKDVLTNQKCGDRNTYGRRWGQCDQWRSSCQNWVEQLVNTASLAVEGVTEAAKPGPNTPTPCKFSQMYSDAMGLINYAVGSYDPVLGESFGDPGTPAHIPRWRSVLFGGANARTDYPYYTIAHKGASDSYYSQEKWKELIPSLRKDISNGEFCRQVITTNYPGRGAVQYPDLIGGCAKKYAFGICGRYECKHWPLIGWDLAFHNLRLELISAVAVYEKTKANVLKGQSLDEYCAFQTAALAAAAPEVLVGAVDQEQFQYNLEQEAETREALAAAEEAELMNELLAAGESGSSPATPILLVGGALIAGIVAFSVIRNRRRA